MNITQGMHRALQQKPEGIATIFQGRRRTYAELGARVEKLAGALQKLSVKAGDRVGMLSINSDR